jgi:predicted metal-dependent enzyme (double-stranded beta helix superfamily)
VANDIHYFANEKQPWNSPRLKRSRLQPGSIHASGGDFGLVKALGSHRMKRVAVQLALTGFQRRI